MAAVTGGISRPPDALGHYTGFLLHWAGSRARETFARAMEDVDLRPQDFVVLTMIDAHPGMTQNELVLTTHTDPSSMVALVDHLEAAGLAERRPHPSDRRKRTVHLTARGRRRLTKARHAIEGLAAETFGRLTESERRDLHRLLRKLAGLDEPVS